MKKLVLMFLLTPCVVMAQNDLLGELEKDSKKETEYAFATFKGTRLGNGHTVETKPAGTLEFIFGHRFGAINGGSYEMFGLDQAYVRLGLDYGITDHLSASIGRNSTDKTMDGYLKYKLLRQSSGVKNFPVSVTVLGGAAYKLSPKDNKEVAPDFENVDRLAYTGQLLIARKFSPNFSFQLMPTLVHKNYVTQSIESNDQFAVGFGGRIKLTRSIALTGEYYYNVSRVSGSPYYDAMSLGIDIETGGHVFQLLLTNAIGLTERAFITETRDNFFDGDIHLGFNVTRAFQLKKNK
ncbi:DUF5777 family beta-barrel protein [Chryseolinea lacunae]|uniref:DUF5777 domain-containing protein n=1 Tax=Chryseolinea lacunae TaxID=2801331 RepID=A0ABS1KYF5_9BACT|nr:DUF5777 family beta-barrel protein [Chryseolinea lacunae]MBL0744302.1 hypothetical protein [Chryseolinea lacunae]